MDNPDRKKPCIVKGMLGLVYWHQHGTHPFYSWNTHSVAVRYPPVQPDPRLTHMSRDMGEISRCKPILEQVTRIWNTYPELGLMTDEIRWYLNKSSKSLFCWHQQRGQYLIDIDYQQLGMAYSKYAKDLELLGSHGIMVIYRTKMAPTRRSWYSSDPEVLHQRWLEDRPCLEEIIDHFQKECGFIELPYNPSRRIKSARSANSTD